MKNAYRGKMCKLPFLSVCQGNFQQILQVQPCPKQVGFKKKIHSNFERDGNNVFFRKTIGFSKKKKKSQNTKQIK